MQKFYAVIIALSTGISPVLAQSFYTSNTYYPGYGNVTTTGIYSDGHEYDNLPSLHLSKLVVKGWKKWRKSKVKHAPDLSLAQF